MFKTRNRKFLGTLAGIAAAVCYGTNPLGALNLYSEGLSTNSVLLYRFGIASIIVAIVLIARKESFKVNAREFKVLSALGILFVVSSFTLYSSFHYMDAGVASTLLFTYPIMTAVIMALFFKERIGWQVVVSILLSFVGVSLLYWSGSSGRLSTVGVLLVLVSALTYAVYIIISNRGHLQMSPFKVTFYVLLYCALFNLIVPLVSGQPIDGLHTPKAWFYALWLAVVPSIFALTLLSYAAKHIGSTPTSILGALEPLTAVLIGIFIFNEEFSFRLAIGIVLILAAVIIIILKPSKSNPS